MVSLAHMRIAAGVCMVSAGLLVGVGGATATADPGDAPKPGDTSGPGSSAGAGAPRQHGPSLRDVARDSVGAVNGVVRQALPSAGGASTLGRAPGAGNTPGGPLSKPGAPAGDDPGDPSTALSDLVEQVTGAPVGNLVGPVDTVLAPVGGVLTPLEDALAPVGVALDPVDDALTPVHGVLAPVNDALAPVGVVLAPVGDVLAPAGDVIAPVVDVVAPVVDSVVAPVVMASADPIGAVTHLPAELSGLFGQAGLGSSATSSVPLRGGAGPAPAADAQVGTDPSRTPVFTALAAGPDGRVIGDAAAGGTLKTSLLPTSTSPQSPVVAMADPPPAGSSLMERVWHYARGVLKSVSLWELALLALPGLCGLLLLTGAGVRIGHVQARAGAALRMSAVARFARQGPLGVVRSGAVGSLYSANHRPRASGAQRFLKEAA